MISSFQLMRSTELCLTHRKERKTRKGHRERERVVRLCVMSSHVGAGRLPVSVDKRRQRWLGLSERSPLTTARTMEQKVTKETKNTRVATRSKIQYVAPDGDNRRLKLGRFLPFVAFATLCSRSLYAWLELENLRVTRRLAFRFRVLPSLPVRQAKLG